MRYRIMVLLAMLIFVAGNCYALHFSSIVKLGNIGGFPTGGFDISGASYNSGTSYRNGKFDKEWKEKIYEKGVARFGTQNRGLWVYYDCSNGMYQNAYHPYFGDKDKTLTVRLGAGEGENVVISQITNNEGMSLFCLNGWGPAAGTSNYIVMGYRSDGSFVKYFDTIEITKNYFPLSKTLLEKPWYKKLYCQEDSIVIEYDIHIPNKGYVKSGEFRFKWDDKAQWFGVEQVVY